MTLTCRWHGIHFHSWIKSPAVLKFLYCLGFLSHHDPIFLQKSAYFKIKNRFISTCQYLFQNNKPSDWYISLMVFNGRILLFNTQLSTLPYRADCIILQRTIYARLDRPFRFLGNKPPEYQAYQSELHSEHLLCRYPYQMRWYTQ
jgi:hypothetical protein